MSTRVLAIDDDQSMCELIEAGLEAHGYDVEWHTQGAAALELFASEQFAAVVTDLNLTHMSGLDICRQIIEQKPDTPVIVITAFGDMQAAIQAIRVGAYDFLNKPLEMEKLAHALDRALEHRALREEVQRLTGEIKRTRGAGDLVGESPPMRKIYDLIQRVSDTDASLLLTGESGTGKELVARAIHQAGAHGDGPFVAINCAAVPTNLLESELFGHVKGAFTDARTPRKGLFEQASGGTILLDEIGELPLEMQPKLLRVLQERKVRPVGSNTEVTFEARVIGATNRDLESEVEAGRFREDLYYRLNVVQIHVPPLRARGNDVLLLAQRFIEQSARTSGKAVIGITSDAAKKLLEFDWPGNVRQLENCMQRAVTLTSYERITVADLPDKISKYESQRLTPVDVDPEHMLTLDELERRYIERVLKVTDGNKTQAAKVLGLDRRTLYRKLERFERGGDGDSKAS